MCGERPRRRFSLVRLVFQVVALYVVLLFGSGTLIKTGNPVAVEVGRIIQVATFVEPTIYWAETRGHRVVAKSVRTLSSGMQIG
jgi:hypothetical protein